MWLYLTFHDFILLLQVIKYYTCLISQLYLDHSPITQIRYFLEEWFANHLGSFKIYLCPVPIQRVLAWSGATSVMIFDSSLSTSTPNVVSLNNISFKVSFVFIFCPTWHILVQVSNTSANFQCQSILFILSHTTATPIYLKLPISSISWSKIFTDFSSTLDGKVLNLLYSQPNNLGNLKNKIK